MAKNYCTECGGTDVRFNRAINRWYCKDCWSKIIGPISAAKAFTQTA